MIAKSLLVREVQGPLSRDNIYFIEPTSGDSGRFTTSTEYFEYLLQEKLIEGQEFCLFGGAGAQPVRTIDPSLFMSDNNAWSVVALEAETSPSQADPPLLISRNLVLPGGRLPVGEDVNLQALIENTPDRYLSFSRKLVIVVSKHGYIYYFRAKDLGPGKAHLLNPTGKPLRVLRP